MQNVLSGNTGQHIRLQFDVAGCNREQNRVAAGIEGVAGTWQRGFSGAGGIGVSSPSAVIPFVKASACGNDFLLIDAAISKAPWMQRRSPDAICDRHEGVGADGVEWMYPHPSADMEIRLINADGSEAEISGNGTRCVAAYVCASSRKKGLRFRPGPD